MKPKSPPPVSQNLPVGLRGPIDSTQERLEVLSGNRGDPLDSAITKRDLLDMGLAQVLGRRAQRLVAGGNYVATQPPPNLAIPPRPENFAVLGGLANIFLTWNSARAAYGNHGYTAIFRNTVDNLGNAIEVAQTTGDAMYADLDVRYGTNYYYWIQFVSKTDVRGPFNSPVGTLGKVSEDPTELLERLSGEITRTQLHADLNTEIDDIKDDINALETVFGSTTSAAQAAIDAAAAAAAAVQARADALQAKNEAIVAQGAALESESLAESHKLQANTYAGQALAHRDAAATSASSSEGSANSASTSAGLAAESRNLAGQYAQAAFESKETAVSSATAAGEAATASQNSRLAAETARSLAETARSDAVSAVNDAQGAAAAASSTLALTIQARDAAGNSASASAQSATNASGFAGAASTSASVAESHKLEAQSFAGSASTSAGNAAQSETNAAGSASQASASAGLAAQSANTAGQHANAAFQSASLAETKAGEASSSASIANGHRIEASNHQSAAGAARDNALGFANAAFTYQEQASTHADNAGTSAATAVSAANTATTKAGEANTFRNQAAQSATDALGFANAAALDYTAVNARLNNMGGTGATVEQRFSATANSITGLSAQYTLKIDVNGRVTGFGLASEPVNGTPISTFIVNADRFAISRPGSVPGTILPFVVDTTDGNKVVMDGAFIKNATINAAQVGTINVGQIVGLNASFISANIENASITNARIANLAVGTHNIQLGAVTAIAASSASDGFSTLDTTLTLLSVGVATNGESVAIVASPEYIVPNSFDSHDVRLYRGGTLIGYVRQGGSMTFIDAPPAGSHTYSLVIAAFYNSNGNPAPVGSFAWYHRSILVMAFKR